LPLPEVTLTSDRENNAVFPSEAIRFTALPGSYDNYEFFVNGNSIQSGPENTFASSKLVNGDSVSVVATQGECVGEPVAVVVNVRDFPNAFTPNGDGRNDLFLKGYDLVVLNRWGQELYRGVDGWDGTFDGKKVSPGTYFYILTLQNITERENIIKGTVLLIQD
jgi:gliding motility-associated-like protein